MIVDEARVAEPEHLDPRRWVALLVVIMAAFIVVLDNTVLNVAIPTIRAEFHTTLPSGDDGIPDRGDWRAANPDAHSRNDSDAPASIALSATMDLLVSIETGMSNRLTSDSIMGTTRAVSSRSLTRVLPGRVDSPPTSIISAPSAIIVSTWRRASSGDRKRPPSEKLSGVTFRMPMTRALSSDNLRRVVCQYIKTINVKKEKSDMLFPFTVRQP